MRKLPEALDVLLRRRRWRCSWPSPWPRERWPCSRRTHGRPRPSARLSPQEAGASRRPARRRKLLPHEKGAYLHFSSTSKGCRSKPSGSCGARLEEKSLAYVDCGGEDCNRRAGLPAPDTDTLGFCLSALRTSRNPVLHRLQSSGTSDPRSRIVALCSRRSAWLPAPKGRGALCSLGLCVRSVVTLTSDSWRGPELAARGWGRAIPIVGCVVGRAVASWARPGIARGGPHASFSPCGSRRRARGATL